MTVFNNSSLAQRREIGKAVMEAVGTGILLMTIQLSVGTGSANAPAAIGLALMAVVYAGGPISGAHYNPAVSLAVLLRGKMEGGVSQLVTYWVAQILGGLAGAAVGGIVLGPSHPNAYVAVGEGYNVFQAAIAEIAFTFVLCLVVLGVATHSASADKSYYGAAIGLTVTAGAVSVGSVSGGAFNPAVAIGLCLASGFSSVGYALMTAVCNLIGGALAAGVFYLAAVDEFEQVTGTASETTLLV